MPVIGSSRIDWLNNQIQTGLGPGRAKTGMGSLLERLTPFWVRTLDH